jgi:hypothetical protein
MPLTRPKAAQVNFDVTTISDPLLRFNSDQTGSNDKDAGFIIERGDDTNVGLVWDESADEFVLINTTEDGTTGGDVTISSYANLQADAITYGSLNDGTTSLTSTAAELNLLDGVTGTLVTETATQTLTNKTLASPTVTGNVAFDTNTLFVDSTNNRVGIGTTSPAVGLDFQMINASEGFRVRRHNASDQYIEISETDGSRHEIKANGTKEFRIVNTTANSGQGFHFYRNSAERLRILGDGLITFQDGAGTVAFTSDITSNSISQGDSSLTVTDSGTGVATLVLDNATHTTFNSSGITLASGVFSGTATSAQYADLAEMYAGDKNYEVGTVVCVGGVKEVTECDAYADSKLAGVVSDKPAYLMNRDIDAEYPICVGFVGRVPVKVVGHIEKGDLLTTSEVKGFATKFSQGSYNPGCIIGISLNDKKDPGEGIVEVLLKRS